MEFLMKEVAEGDMRASNEFLERDQVRQTSPLPHLFY